MAEHAGLPPSEAVYSYHPITFLITLAARAGNVEMHWPPRAPVADSDLEPRPADHRIIDAWTRERFNVRDGKPVLASRRAVSQDGKTMTITILNVDQRGKEVIVETRILEKQ